jgi:mRNA deadenylase 3'-5' endonuclease subunit Ccr4
MARFGAYMDNHSASLLKQVRQEPQLSQAGVAKRGGLDRSAISRLEDDMYDNIAIRTWSRLAGAHGKRFLVQLVDEHADGESGCTSRREVLLDMGSNMTTVRVVTYNVLSSHLSEPDHFTHCHPSHLEPASRFRHLQHKLEVELRQDAIICLQEISQQWVGPLHAFFQQRQYYFVTALYGGAWSGYMGVGLAWPTAVYEAAQVDIKRLVDSRRWPSPPTSHVWGRASRRAVSGLAGLWRRGLRLAGSEMEAPFDPWAAAQERSNELICACLCHRQDRSAFCVSTYHMPCLYGSAKKRQTMMIHASLAAQYTQAFAADRPYVLAGDFNLIPGSSAYRLLTEGQWPVEHEDFPTPRANDDTGWDVNRVKPLRSAYRVKNGKEPDFTNHARVGDDPVFTDTLDYIFLSPHWSVEKVVELPAQADLKELFPNALEPSDHLLLGARLSIGGP